MYLGSVPEADLSIAAEKPYVFIYNTYSTEATIRGKIADLSAYAKNITVKKDGMKKAIVELTPLYAMKLSVWRDLFKGIGLTDLKDMYVGTVSQATYKESFNPIQNVATYWEPKITAAKKALTDDLSKMFDYIKWVAIAGAVIVGGVVVLTYLPKPRYKENPRKRKKRYIK